VSPEEALCTLLQRPALLSSSLVTWREPRSFETLIVVSDRISKTVSSTEIQEPYTETGISCCVYWAKRRYNCDPAIVEKVVGEYCASKSDKEVLKPLVGKATPWFEWLRHRDLANS
jgi:hypothetical protein